MAILHEINDPSDIRKLTRHELVKLADEIRKELIHVTSVNGGHLGPNLGVVELTLALHRVFDSPRDKFTFDVSHQGYVHKLLTGRQGNGFKNIRMTGGVSGFLCRTESAHDSYGAGHAGTGLSAAIGMAVARDIRGSDEHVVAVVGDAGLTCGITMEALNNVATHTKRLIVVINDNKWSISPNVGAISKYLNELITNPIYNRLDQDVSKFLEKLPGGESLIKIGRKAKKEAKELFVPSSLFENYGLRYLGPIEGNDLEAVTHYLEFCKNCDRPVVLHIMTTKGKGYEPALKDPEKFHGPSPFNITTGKSKPGNPGSPPKFQDVFGRAMVRFAKEDPKVVGITAAMSAGTSLNMLREASPKQFFDVGMAEEHAVLFAAGLATQGFRPVCAIYSTMLQRAYDPIIHDVGVQNLPVTFCMDRAGLSPQDGPTPHGLFDIAYLRCIPGTIVMQPKDEDELVDMLWTSLYTSEPTFVRYPRGEASGVTIKDDPQYIDIGKAEVLREGKKLVFWALGPWVQEALKLADRLEVEEGISAGVVNARFAKPIDLELLMQHASKTELIVTMEDHVSKGGFGSSVLEALNESSCDIPVEIVGWPDRFVDHGSSVGDLRAVNDLDNNSIYDRILKRLNQISVPRERATLAH